MFALAHRAKFDDPRQKPATPRSLLPRAVPATGKLVGCGTEEAGSTFSFACRANDPARRVPLLKDGKPVSNLTEALEARDELLHQRRHGEAFPARGRKPILSEAIRNYIDYHRRLDPHEDRFVFHIPFGRFQAAYDMLFDDSASGHVIWQGGDRSSSPRRSYLGYRTLSVGVRGSENGLRP